MDDLCALCKQPLGEDDWNLDHIVPRARGGSNAKSNLQRVHIECNQLKGAYEPVVYCTGCQKRMPYTHVNRHWKNLAGSLSHTPFIPMRITDAPAPKLPATPKKKKRMTLAKRFQKQTLGPIERVPLAGPLP